MSPEQFTQIKQKIESSLAMTAKEKQEWLFLLPRMNIEELKELDRILSVQLPSSNMDGIQKTQADHKEFMTHLVEHKHRDGEYATEPSTLKPSPPRGGNIPGTLRRPEFVEARPLASPGLTNLLRLSADDIRKPPSIYVCLEKVRQDIDTMLKKTDISPHKILESFQNSPLYRDYLRTGVLFINNNQDAPLTHEELEAITDFHASLKDLEKQ